MIRHWFDRPAAVRWRCLLLASAAGLLAVACPARGAGPPGLCLTPPWWWTPPATWPSWWQPGGCGPKPLGYNGRITSGGDTFAYGCPAPEEWRAICRLYEGGPPPKPKYLCSSVNDPMGTQVPTGEKCVPNPDAITASLLAPTIGSGLSMPAASKRVPAPRSRGPAPERPAPARPGRLPAPGDSGAGETPGDLPPLSETTTPGKAGTSSSSGRDEGGRPASRLKVIRPPVQRAVKVPGTAGDSR